MSFAGLVCLKAIRLKVICSSPQGITHVFSIWKFPGKCAKHFVFFLIKVKPFVPFFPQFLKLLCFLIGAAAGIVDVMLHVLELVFLWTFQQVVF